VDTKKEIEQYEAIPINQQSHPDFLRIMEAFRMIKDACEKLGTNPATGQRRDLTDEEINWVVQKIVAGKKGVLHPDNPFLREDDKGNKLEMEYVCGSIMEFVRHCEKTRIRDQNLRVEPNLDIFNYKTFIESKPWEKGLVTDDDEKAAIDDIMFEKIQGAEADLKHKDPEKYFKVVTDILDNKNRDAFPNPNKYHWACQQIKESGTLRWKITESASDGKQEVTFKITLGGHTFERTIDFQRQINQQQASALDRKDVVHTHADLSHANPDENPEALEKESEQKTMEVPVDTAVGEKEQIKTRAPVHQKSDERDVVSSDFEGIKEAFGYDKNNPDHIGQFVNPDDNNKRDIFAKILFDYRDMPDVNASILRTLSPDSLELR